MTSLDFSLNMMERLKEIPESRAVMRSVREVKITYSNLTTVSPTDFELVPNLIKLDLSCNKLSRVAPYAFRGLSSLQSLRPQGSDCEGGRVRARGAAHRA